MVLTLYKLDASTPSRSVLMVIHIAKIPDVQYVDVNLLEGEHLKEEFLRLNPQHTIPMLKDDDFVVWDSHAIAVYLLTKYSNDTALYPSDPKKRAIIHQRLHFDSGMLFPCLWSAVESIVFKGEKSFRPEALERIKLAYELSEKFLESSPWMAGNEMTLADICCIATISTMNAILPIDVAKFANLTAWLNRCEELDFYKTVNEPGLTQLQNVLKSKLTG